MSARDFSPIKAFDQFLLAPCDKWQKLRTDSQHPPAIHERPCDPVFEFLEARSKEFGYSATSTKCDFLYFESLCGDTPYVSICLLEIPSKGGKPYGGRSLEELANQLRRYLDTVPQQVCEFVKNIASVNAYWQAAQFSRHITSRQYQDLEITTRTDNTSEAPQHDSVSGLDFSMVPATAKLNQNVQNAKRDWDTHNKWLPQVKYPSCQRCKKKKLKCAFDATQGSCSECNDKRLICLFQQPESQSTRSQKRKKAHTPPETDLPSECSRLAKGLSNGTINDMPAPQHDRAPPNLFQISLRAVTSPNASPLDTRPSCVAANNSATFVSDEYSAIGMPEMFAPEELCQ